MGGCLGGDHKPTQAKAVQTNLSSSKIKSKPRKRRLLWCPSSTLQNIVNTPPEPDESYFCTNSVSQLKRQLYEDFMRGAHKKRRKKTPSKNAPPKTFDVPRQRSLESSKVDYAKITPEIPFAKKIDENSSCDCPYIDELSTVAKNTTAIGTETFDFESTRTPLVYSSTDPDTTTSSAARKFCSEKIRQCGSGIGSASHWKHCNDIVLSTLAPRSGPRTDFEKSFHRLVERNQGGSEQSILTESGSPTTTTTLSERCICEYSDSMIRDEAKRRKLQLFSGNYGREEVRKKTDPEFLNRCRMALAKTNEMYVLNRGTGEPPPAQKFSLELPNRQTQPKDRDVLGPPGTFQNLVVELVTNGRSYKTSQLPPVETMKIRPSRASNGVHNDTSHLTSE